ncbi:MAG: hypothetical protein PVSMB10_12500 [Pseudarthrobacter sp.]
MPCNYDKVAASPNPPQYPRARNAEMAQSYFQVVVRYTVKPEETETVLRLLSEMAAATRAEEANLS